MNRDFKGIWIPKDIWLNKNLTMQEKLFFVEINSLDNSNGCFASNGYFSEFFGISKTRVSLVIKSLIEKGYLESNIIYKEGTKEILKRVLKICYTPYLTKVKDPIQQKLKDNNTINNTINKCVSQSQILFSKTKDDFTEQQFLQRWKDARLKFDKKPTNLSKLMPFERVDFEELKKHYTRNEIEKAMQGMFQQKTLPSVRLRPTHFLKMNYFEQYLTCFTTKEVLYKDNNFKKPIERI